MGDVVEKLYDYTEIKNIVVFRTSTNTIPRVELFMGIHICLGAQNGIIFFCSGFPKVAFKGEISSCIFKDENN